MEHLGEYLRKERELRNLSLEEVEKATRIKARFLCAIEEDRFESLPSSFYIKGFLRLYAEFLGLNPNDVLNRFQQGKNDLSVKPPEIKAFLVPRKRRISFSALFFLVSGIILVSAMVYWVSREPRKLITSSGFLQPAATSTPVQVPRAQEKREAISQLETKAEESSEPKGAGDTEGTGAPGFLVLEAGFGEGVETVQNRVKLTGASSQFTCNHQRVYFLTRIRSQTNGKISHAWFWEGKEVQTIDMEVQAPAWSIFSYVTTRPDRTGQWRVEVRDGSTVLSSHAFRVLESSRLPERTGGSQISRRKDSWFPHYAYL